MNVGDGHDRDIDGECWPDCPACAMRPRIAVVEVSPATIAALTRDLALESRAPFSEAEVRGVVARVGLTRARAMLTIAARAGQGVALTHLAIDIAERERRRGHKKGAQGAEQGAVNASKTADSGGAEAVPLGDGANPQKAGND